MIILTFSPSDVDTHPTMTSADFCKYQRISLLHSIPCCFFGILAYLRQLIYRPLRVSSLPFYSCNPFIYASKLCAVLDFCFFSNIIRLDPPHIKFLFVGSNICRLLLSDSRSPPTPLQLANDKYCNSRSGLTPYSVMNMPDTHKKGA